MKHSALLFKSLLVIALFTTGSIALSSAGVKTVSEAQAAVSQQQVNAYLTSRGYTVISLMQYKTTSDWVARTILNGRDFTTHVYVTGNQIIGTEDVPFY